MSRGLATRKQHVEALIIRLKECSHDLSHWCGSYELGDEAVRLFYLADAELRDALENTKAACKLMPEEE